MTKPGLIHDSMAQALTNASTVAELRGAKTVEVKDFVVACLMNQDVALLAAEILGVNDDTVDQFLKDYIGNGMTTDEIVERVAAAISIGAPIFSDELLGMVRNSESIAIPEDVLLKLLPEKPKEAVEETVATKIDIPHTYDLTQMARDGELDPVIGREREIHTIETILLKRTKNSPILVGDPGVGKTALVESLAQRIVDGTSHPRLRGKRILMLDMAAIIADTTLRGQFEGRLKEMLEKLELDKTAILFIDEAHMIVGAGASGRESGPDMSNILKPALARRRIQVIAATTHDEYDKISSDGALARRFNPVIISEPDTKETVRILTGIREAMEKYHGVSIDEQAVGETVRVSKAHIHSGRMPDKAIDLLDEACTIASRRVDSNPDKERAEDELRTLADEFAAHVQAGDFKQASAFRVSIDAKEQEIAALVPIKTDRRVIPSDVHSAVYNKIGAVVSMYDKGTKESMVDVIKTAKSKIVGMDKQIEEIADVLRTGYALSRNPLGVILLYGPAGSGKTELAEAFSSSFSKVLKINLANYHTTESSTTLFGSSRGYRDSEQGGILVNGLRNHPSTLLIFENIGVAHQSVSQTISSAISQGFLRDGLGREATLKDALIIFTATVGEPSKGSLGFSAQTSTSFGVPPEVATEIVGLARAIATTVLSKEDLPAFVELQLSKLAARLERGITFTKDTVDLLCKEYDPKTGCRSISKAIEKLVEAAIADNPGYHPVHLVVVQGVIRVEQKGDLRSAEKYVGQAS